MIKSVSLGNRVSLGKLRSEIDVYVCVCFLVFPMVISLNGEWLTRESCNLFQNLKGYLEICWFLDQGGACFRCYMVLVVNKFKSIQESGSWFIYSQMQLFFCIACLTEHSEALTMSDWKVLISLIINPSTRTNLFLNLLMRE